MIEPTKKDIGREVVYYSAARGLIEGPIVSLSKVNKETVMVNFPQWDTPQATSIKKLSWKEET